MKITGNIPWRAFWKTWWPPGTTEVRLSSEHQNVWQSNPAWSWNDVQRSGYKNHRRLTNVGITTINHPFGNSLYHPFMVIRGMVYYCYTHIMDVWRFWVSVGLHRTPVTWSKQHPVGTWRDMLRGSKVQFFRQHRATWLILFQVPVLIPNLNMSCLWRQVNRVKCASLGSTSILAIPHGSTQFTNLIQCHKHFIHVSCHIPNLES